MSLSKYLCTIVHRKWVCSIYKSWALVWDGGAGSFLSMPPSCINILTVSFHKNVGKDMKEIEMGEGAKADEGDGAGDWEI